jgi:hypothetical protein
MATWGELRGVRPDLAEGGRGLLYQHGVGLAFLATLRPAGGPRLHPICPLLTDGSMFGFIIPSPKQRDLHHDGRYALHSFPTDDNEDAFYVTGRARLVEDPVARDALGAQFVAERVALNVPTPAEADHLFEFHFETCLLTRTKGFGDGDPQHVVWREGSAGRAGRDLSAGAELADRVGPFGQAKIVGGLVIGRAGGA